MDLSNKIEAILFWKGEPITVKKLSQILKKSEEEVSTALLELEKNLSERGIVLMRKDDEVTLGTNVAVSSLIESLTKDELMRDLGKAGLETLSIVIYKGPIKRADIDYIRGVNSSFILRNLLVRGLVERITAPSVHSGDPSTGVGQTGRGFLYKPTFQLLSYLGVANIHELPEYDKVREEIKAFEDSAHSTDSVQAGSSEEEPARIEEEKDVTENTKTDQVVETQEKE